MEIFQFMFAKHEDVDGLLQIILKVLFKAGFQILKFKLDINIDI